MPKIVCKRGEQSPLKGKPKSKAHVEAVRRGLLKYFAKHGGHPSEKKGLKAWDAYHLAYQSFRCRGVSEQVAKMYATQMFWLPTKKMRKHYFKLTKDQQSSFYLEGSRCMPEAQKEYYRSLYIGKKKGPLSEEQKAKMSKAAIKNLKSGRTKPAANSIKGTFFSVKNNTECKYKSGWEKCVSKALEKADNILAYSVEPFYIRYMFNGKEHLYFPDYEIKVKGKSRLRVVEIKPKDLLTDPKVIAKLAVLKSYCKNKDKKMIVLTEREIFGGGNPISGLC